MRKETRSTYRVPVSTLQGLADEINNILAEGGDRHITEIEAYFDTEVVRDMQGGMREIAVGAVGIVVIDNERETP